MPRTGLAVAADEGPPRPEVGPFAVRDPEKGRQRGRKRIDLGCRDPERSFLRVLPPHCPPGQFGSDRDASVALTYGVEKDLTVFGPPFRAAEPILRHRR